MFVRKLVTVAVCLGALAAGGCYDGGGYAPPRGYYQPVYGWVDVPHCTVPVFFRGRVVGTTPGCWRRELRRIG